MLQPLRYCWLYAVVLSAARPAPNLSTPLAPCNTPAKS